MNTHPRAQSSSLLRRATTGGVAPSSTPPVTLSPSVGFVVRPSRSQWLSTPLAGVGCDADRQLIHQRQMSGPSRVGTARGFSIQALAAREDAQDWPAFRRAGLLHRHCSTSLTTSPRPRAGGLFRAGGRGCRPAHAIHFNAADHVYQNLVQPLPSHSTKSFRLGSVDVDDPRARRLEACSRIPCMRFNP